jgi:uncharacterized zinc-type alcohol dehydrogenase-like protein
MQDNNHSSRRQFIHQSAMAGAGLMLAGPLQVFSQSNHQSVTVATLSQKAMQVKMSMEN